MMPKYQEAARAFLSFGMFWRVDWIWLGRRCVPACLSPRQLVAELTLLEQSVALTYNALQATSHGDE
jgi:hypothetical protein